MKWIQLVILFSLLTSCGIPIRNVIEPREVLVPPPDEKELHLTFNSAVDVTDNSINYY